MLGKQRRSACAAWAAGLQKAEAIASGSKHHHEAVAMSMGETFRAHHKSLAGRIVIAGGGFNLLLAGFHAWQAWEFIPGPRAEEFAALTLPCLAAPVALVGTWMSYSRRLSHRPSILLAVLLLSIAAAPLLLTCLGAA